MRCLPPTGTIKLLAAFLFSCLLTLPVWASHLGSEEDEPTRKRPLYEYKGDYRGEINELKEKFQSAFGYVLMDLDRGWTSDEIRKLHEAFDLLPDIFHRIPGLKGFYRANQLQAGKQAMVPGEVFAATFPPLTTIYRQAAKHHLVMVADEQPRIEFYNDLFYLDKKVFQNIVHHEMGHIFDLFHEFPSLQPDWLTLAGFRIHNMPALDAEPGSDFIYTLLNNPDTMRYAPVSDLQHPIHSRENAMEDFANSVAGYIHYPYFRYTNPERYRFMKEKVFLGKEYFVERPGSYAELIEGDFKQAVGKEDWQGVLDILQEAARTIHPEADQKLMQVLKKAMETPRPRDIDHKLAAASCFLQSPDALLLRQEMWADQRIDTETILKFPRCGGMQKKIFQEQLSKTPVMNLYFYLEDKEAWIQFLDPTLFVAQARGFQTSYKWRLLLAQGRQWRLAASGETGYMSDPDGSVRVSLNKSTLRGPDFQFPTERMARIEVWAERKHPQFPKVFSSEVNTIQVVAKPWFEYFGPTPPSTHVVYPPLVGKYVEPVR
ncbi:hypothetical protein ACTRW9_06685 [Nitrospina sp. 32_T5]|uniref:hypothetical protein n=1 Tax=unclassified Nitrospina TaxID=2638683 RepID=UPI003F997037